MWLCRWVLSFSTSVLTAEWVTTSAPVPWMMMPDEGQGARKVKSYMLAGGDTAMQPLISGRRIKSCIPINAPQDTPSTQVVLGYGWICSHQSSAATAPQSRSEESRVEKGGVRSGRSRGGECTK